MILSLRNFSLLLIWRDKNINSSRWCHSKTKCLDIVLISSILQLVSDIKKSWKLLEIQTHMPRHITKIFLLTFFWWFFVNMLSRHLIFVVFSLCQNIKALYKEIAICVIFIVVVLSTMCIRFCRGLT